ncbi:MAG: hypothetical protein ACR2FN_03345 [Chitinophagaceae bacterium]
MNQQQLATALANLSGNLEVSSPDEKKMLDNLHQQLATAITDENISSIKGTNFSFENAKYCRKPRRQAITQAYE